MPNAPFPIQQELTAITIAYRNSTYVADEVAPRVPVGRQEYKLTTYPISETFALPSTLVGRKGRPGEVDLTATEGTHSTKDYGLEDPIPQADIDNAAPNRNPRARAVMQLTDYIMLDREKRVADLVFAAGAYASSNKTQLSGTSQWSDFTNGDPIGVLSAGIDACLVRPNRLVLGRAVWTKLRMHPKIVQAVVSSGGSSATNGMVSRQQFADLFELEQVVVGESWVNTAKKGQTASLSRVWGKHALLYYFNPLADTQGGMTFALTAQWGERVSGERPDPDIGLRGGTRVRVGESVNEHIIAPLAAYFVQDAVA
jgi:hypothetical protein